MIIVNVLNQNVLTMNRTVFLQEKVNNLCERLVKEYGADASKVDMLRSQLRPSRIDEYLKHVQTHDDVGHVCELAKTLVGSDHQSIFLIEQYVNCFRDVMKNNSHLPSH